MPREFVCCECGRPIIQIIREEPGKESPLCAHCLMVPGWFRNPALRDVMDPSHDGREHGLPIALAQQGSP